MTAVKQADLYKPILRAYALAYLSTSTPQLLSLTLAVLSRRKGLTQAGERALSTLRNAAELHSFPTCAGLLIAGTTVLPRLVSDFLTALQSSSEGKRKSATLDRHPLVRFLSSFAASLLVFRLLNNGSSKPLRMRRSSFQVEDEPAIAPYPNVPQSVPVPTAPRVRSKQQPAGNTILFTAFALLHAVIATSSTYLARPQASVRSKERAKTMGGILPSSTFIVSSSIIMWSWFYHPDRLPNSYVNWITSAAQIDERLIEALRQCRKGRFAYGKNTGIAPLLGGMAKDMGYPEVWGDPERTIPLPCELYHSGSGPNCEYHALSRFVRGWLFAMRMYIPLNLIILTYRVPTVRAVRGALLAASRSAAFLSAFVAFFYYGVCLTRTRLGPLLLGTSIAARQKLDAGLCIGTGCLACGWSIMLEKSHRRNEMALFVAPRALAALVPKQYDRKYIWREQFVFAISAATVFTVARQRPESIKGVFGRVLRRIYKSA